jgi:branched-chain amino acid transport system substrate-binding protein
MSSHQCNFYFAIPSNNLTEEVDMKNFLLAITLIFSVVLSQACVQKGGEATDADAGDNIKVGVYVDLSGATSSFGKSTKNGIELATEEINKNGGVLGKQLQLVIEDDQGRPEQAKTVVQKLISQDKVNVVLGEVASTNSLAAAPVAQEAKIPMISPSSTNPKVTEVGDYIFRVCFIDPFQGSVMAKFAATELNAKTAAIFGDVQSDYSKGLTNFFEQEFNKLGGKVIDKQAYTQNDADFKSQLTNIRQKNPDVIYVPGYYGEVGIIAKQARELGMNMPILGGDGWDSPEIWKLGGDALKNTYISNHYSVENPDPATQKFVKAYEAKFGVKPDSLAALAYDAAYVLADSLKRAGTADPAKLRDAIAATKDFNGITGNITINGERNAVKSAVVLALNPADNKLEFKTTIAPPGAETSDTTDANSNSSMDSNSMSNSTNSSANTNSTAMEKTDGNSSNK